MRTLLATSVLLLLVLPVASSIVIPDVSGRRATNRAAILADMPSFSGSNQAVLIQTPDMQPRLMSAQQALEAQLDFLEDNLIDLLDQASLPADWPLLYRIRIDETGDRAFAPPGETLACPVPKPLPEPLPTQFQSVWPQAYPNIPPEVRSTLFLPASDAKAQTATSRISFFMDPTGDGASATSFTPGDDPTDHVDLQRTIRYQDTEVGFGPIVKFSCFTTRNLQGQVLTARLSATVNGIADDAPLVL